MCFTNLDSLPYDSFYEISKYLDNNDLISLSNVNKALRQTLESEQIARKTVKNFLLFSKEGRAATSGETTYRRAIGHRADIHDAVATASPCSVAVLAHADLFVYKQGVLCYQVANQIRLLDVHGSAREERVINLIHLTNTISQIQPRIGKEPHMVVLHYCEDIISLQMKGVGGLDYIVAIDMRPHTDSSSRERTLHDRLVYFAPLPGRYTQHFWVRNSRSFYWVGTYHEINSVGLSWDITVTDLNSTQPRDDVSYFLDDSWTPDPDNDIGSSTWFDVFDDHLYVVSTNNFDEDDEVHSSFYYWQCLPPTDGKKKGAGRIWRRKHEEGTVNELWTVFSLERDETTNRPMILECRREWLRPGSSENHRAYYVEPLPFPEEALRTEEPVPDTWAHDEQQYPNSPEEFDERPAKRQRRNEEYKPISDQFIHRRTRHRSYHLATSTFIDLVTNHNSSQLILRTCPTRKRRYSLTEDEVYPHEVHFWPPAGAPRALLDILCPDQNSDGVTACNDERSIIYSVNCGGYNALVLISFDPKIRLPTMDSLYSGPHTPKKVFPAEVVSPEGCNSGVATCPPLYEAIKWGYWLR